KRAPWSPFAATVSAAENCQCGKIDCTISNPCATHSTQESSAPSSISVDGARARANNDLGLDPGLGELSQRKRCGRGQIMQSRLVEIAPDRRIDLVLLPDRAVGETDLAPAPDLAAGFQL